MIIRLEKPAVNISILTGGKNEKARRGALHEKIRLDMYFGVFTGFFNTCSNFFFNDYDVTTLKIIHPITFRIIQTNQTKCCEIKITSWKHATFLYNGSPHSI